MIRWFCWFEKYKSTNNYWFIKPSTNSTNQQKMFVENFDEFCLNLLVRLQFTLKFSLNLLKISTNQRKFSTNSTNHQNQRLVDSLIWFRWFCWFVEFVEKINKNKKQQIILDLFWSPGHAQQLVKKQIHLKYLRQIAELRLYLNRQPEPV